MRDAVAAAHERIREVVRETPVEYSPAFSVFLKLEHLQHTGSFKFRGASHKISLLAGERSVITASNGNHGLGVAAAAQARGIAAEVFVSAQVSPEKALRIEHFGATVRCAGDDSLTAELAARAESVRSGRPFISPYNDLDVMAGQGTIALELLGQLPRLEAVFVAVGGGGLIGGIGGYLKAVAPHVEVIGCWPENSPVMWECMQAGRIIDVPESATVSESTSGGLEPDSVTLDVCRRVIDRAVMVTEEEILAAMRLLLTTEHWVVEGAAGVALAAFLKEKARYANGRAAVVLCGRNVSARVFSLL